MAYGAAGSLKWAARYKDPYGLAGRRMWLDRHSARDAFPPPDIAVTPGGRTLIVTVPLNHGTSYAIASYNASTGRTRWTQGAPVSVGRPSGLVTSSDADTLFIGGNCTTAHSVAGGTVR